MRISKYNVLVAWKEKQSVFWEIGNCDEEQLRAKFGTAMVQLRFNCFLTTAGLKLQQTVLNYIKPSTII